MRIYMAVALKHGIVFKVSTMLRLHAPDADARAYSLTKSSGALPPAR